MLLKRCFNDGVTTLIPVFTQAKCKARRHVVVGVVFMSQVEKSTTCDVSMGAPGGIVEEEEEGQEGEGAGDREARGRQEGGEVGGGETGSTSATTTWAREDWLCFAAPWSEEGGGIGPFRMVDHECINQEILDVHVHLYK